MGDVDGGRLQAPLQLQDLRAHLHAPLRVEVRERLVEQEHRRLADDGTADGDALPLPAGELLGSAVEQVADAEGVGHLAHQLGDLGRRHLADPQPNSRFCRTDVCG